MSTGKGDYLVQAPIDPSALQAWASNRDEHIAHLKPYILDGTIVFGGPTIAAHPESPEDKIEVRSRKTENEVRGIIEKNPFVDAGVWDMEKVVIAPFKCGVRTAM
ncbi:unnamed protein product [Penicillium glandicola]